MELKLENLKYQDNAIKSVVKVFDGTQEKTLSIPIIFLKIKKHIGKMLE